MLKKLDSVINVTKSFLPPFEEYIQEIERIWSSSWLTNNGMIHKEFEERLIKYLDANNVSLLVNGHLALETAIKALRLEGEVITTPFTFASTTHAINNCGLTPVFCDINPIDFNIDVNKLESLITEKTSAIIPVHVFGNPCNVDEIKRISDKYGLKVIYDAAHAFGVKIDGKAIGNYGDISMFSMHATKVFHSIEGGVLVYNNNSYKEFIDLYKNFGISGPEIVESVGINAKMNEFQAAMGVVNLRHIDSEICKRRVVSDRYKSNLKGVLGLKVMEDKVNVTHNYAYFPIVITEELYGISRDTLHEKLKDYNIFTRKYFYPLCSDFDCYAHLDSRCKLDNAKLIADSVLTLPIYSGLSLEIIDYICDVIKHK